MSTTREPGVRGVAAPAEACAECRRRTDLLDALSSPLDFCARDRDRLLAALALPDEEMVAALGGSHREQTRTRYDTFSATARAAPGAGIESICRHLPTYPDRLRTRSSPVMLSVLGGGSRFADLARGPTVAILGTCAPSDYGRAVAGALARGLASCDVTTVAVLDGGIAAAALNGALQARGAAIAVLGHGLGVPPPSTLRALPRLVSIGGSVVSELPDGLRTRTWGPVAAVRTVVALAQVAVFVEGGASIAELFAARLAQSSNKPLGAVPGRVTSPLAAGPHRLIARGATGATLVSGAQDVLDLLPCGDGTDRAARREPNADRRLSGLDAHVREILDRVGCGCDTAGQLTAASEDPGAVLAALSELEVLGLLARGDGGRYLLCDATSV